MPKPLKSHPDWPAPIQLPLFPEEASLVRIRPDKHEWRYYRLAVWPDLFGRALLARHWGGAGQGSASASWRNAGGGRIGTPGRIRLDPHPDTGAALNALARLAGTKRRRGYRDRPA